jgi:hypothetical protein
MVSRDIPSPSRNIFELNRFQLPCSLPAIRASSDQRTTFGRFARTALAPSNPAGHKI